MRRGPVKRSRARRREPAAGGDKKPRARLSANKFANIKAELNFAVYALLLSELISSAGGKNIKLLIRHPPRVNTLFSDKTVTSFMARESAPSFSEIGRGWGERRSLRAAELCMRCCAYFTRLARAQRTVCSYPTGSFAAVAEIEGGSKRGRRTLMENEVIFRFVIEKCV